MSIPTGSATCPTTYLKVPAGAVVHMTIDQQDGQTGLRNEYLGLVRGTINNQMTVNGKVVGALDPSLAAHTFTIPDLGVSVPLEGVPSNAAANAQERRSSSTSWYRTSPGSSAGSASFPARRGRSTATVDPCKRSATWPASSRWADR